MFFDAQYLTGQLINHDFFLMCLTLSLSGLVGKPLLGKEDFGKPFCCCFDGGWALCFHFKLCCSAKNSDTNPGVLRDYL